jgi:hypothetical protein
MQVSMHRVRFLSDFNQNSNILKNVSDKLSTIILYKSLVTCRNTGGHDESDMRIF